MMMRNAFGQILITHQKKKWNQFTKIVDHFAQDGLAPLLSQKVDKWDEKQFKTWCDYHYSVCREQSVLGASNHVIIIGRK